MAGSTQGLEVGPIPEQAGLTLVFTDVVDLQLEVDTTTLGARKHGLDEDLLAEAGPAVETVPAVRELIVRAMSPTIPMRHAH
jgi:hypothetical protein